MPHSQLTYPTMLYRALRLRCPQCGQGKACRNWIRMQDECSECHLDFRREPGFYLGSIYVNYGLTAVLLTLVCGPLVMTNAVSHFWMTPIALLFCAGFPVWFLRYARCIWLGFDQMIDGESSARSRAEQARVKAIQDAEDSDQPAADTQSPSSGHVQKCPFCHTASTFPDDASGSWTRCPTCDAKMLIAK